MFQDIIHREAYSGFVVTLKSLVEIGFLSEDESDLGEGFPKIRGDKLEVEGFDKVCVVFCQEAGVFDRDLVLVGQLGEDWLVGVGEDMVGGGQHVVIIYSWQ